MNREKLEQTLRKVIEDRNARSLGERSEIYSAARSSVRKATNEEPAVLADVDDVIEAVEASFTPAKTVQKDEDARPGRARRLPALLAGVVLGGAATAAALMFGLHFQPESPIAAKLMQQYEATAPLVPISANYLHKVANNCLGFVDKVNGQPLHGKLVESPERYLTLSGWFISSVGDLDKVAPQVLVQIAYDNGQKSFYAAQRTARPDVNAHFKRPDLPDVGYTASINLPEAGKAYEVTIATKDNTSVKLCHNLSVRIYP